jgi:hypothetical protein
MKLSTLFGRPQGILSISLAIVLLGSGTASAQQGQGKYVAEASARLIKLINSANGDGYILQDNSFSIGGGWLKQGRDLWVPLYTVQLQAGREYRFLASGDADARDVDLQIVGPGGNVVASDVDTAADAIVNFRPNASGRYEVRIRLYDSDNNLPCVCMGIMMIRK